MTPLTISTFFRAIEYAFQVRLFAESPLKTWLVFALTNAKSITRTVFELQSRMCCSSGYVEALGRPPQTLPLAQVPATSVQPWLYQLVGEKSAFCSLYSAFWKRSKHLQNVDTLEQTIGCFLTCSCFSVHSGFVWSSLPDEWQANGGVIADGRDSWQYNKGRCGCVLGSFRILSKSTQQCWYVEGEWYTTQRHPSFGRKVWQCEDGFSKDHPIDKPQMLQGAYKKTLEWEAAVSTYQFSDCADASSLYAAITEKLPEYNEVTASALFLQFLPCAYLFGIVLVSVDEVAQQTSVRGHLCRFLVFKLGQTRSSRHLSFRTVYVSVLEGYVSKQRKFGFLDHNTAFNSQPRKTRCGLFKYRCLSVCFSFAVAFPADVGSPAGEDGILNLPEIKALQEQRFCSRMDNGTHVWCGNAACKMWGRLQCWCAKCFAGWNWTFAETSALPKAAVRITFASSAPNIMHGGVFTERFIYLLQNLAKQIQKSGEAIHLINSTPEVSKHIQWNCPCLSPMQWRINNKLFLIVRRL